MTLRFMTLDFSKKYTTKRQIKQEDESNMTISDAMRKNGM